MVRTGLGVGLAVKILAHLEMVLSRLTNTEFQREDDKRIDPLPLRRLGWR